MIYYMGLYLGKLNKPDRSIVYINQYNNIKKPYNGHPVTYLLLTLSLILAIIGDSNECRCHPHKVILKLLSTSKLKWCIGYTHIHRHIYHTKCVRLIIYDFINCSFLSRIGLHRSIYRDVGRSSDVTDQIVCNCM